ncbi:hypothetical protein [Marinobacter sp.]|uniref:hypothetical protein n=1 Tax=Marinobacter sp. TaxID=50741 RepID=UPI003F9D4C51
MALTRLTVEVAGDFKVKGGHLAAGVSASPIQKPTRKRPVVPMLERLTALSSPVTSVLLGNL